MNPHPLPRSGQLPDLTDREFGFVTEQYRLSVQRIGQWQTEREQWIRTSILATSAYFGWVTSQGTIVAMTFMLGQTELQVINLVPVIFNLGGALRFYFIRRDNDRLARFLYRPERERLRLPAHVGGAVNGQGLRDRHWHTPSILYWATIVAASAGV